MERGNRIVTVTDPITGITESRRVLTWDDIAFSIEMALMQNVWAGTPHAKREGIKRMIVAAIGEQFRVSGYQVLGTVPKATPSNPDVYMGGNPDKAG